MPRKIRKLDRVDLVQRRGLAATSHNGAVLAGVARGLDQLFPVEIRTSEMPNSAVTLLGSETRSRAN